LPFEGEEVKVGCVGEPIVSLINRHIPVWQRKSGARVQVVISPAGKGPDSIEGASIWIVRPAELPRWAAANQLLPVPADYRSASSPYGWLGILPLYREKLLKWASEVYGFPLLGDATVCFCRLDLFSDTTHQKRFRESYKHNLKPPATWEEFADIAEYFYSSRDVGKKAPSLAPLPDTAEELDALFYTVAAPFARRAIYQDETKPPTDEELFSFHYNQTTGQVRIDQPGFVHALKVLQKLQAFRPSEASAEPAQAFAEDRAVLCLAEPAWIARFLKKLRPEAIGVCEVPGSARWFSFHEGKEMASARDGNHIPYQGAGGWIAVVPRSAPHADAAFALLAELSGRATSMQLVFDPQWGGGAYRQEHLESAQNWYSFELNSTQTVALKEAVRQALARPGLQNPVVRLRTPDQGAHQEALVAELRKALLKERSAEEALNAALRRWNELDATKDLKTRKNEYLLSLGLTAQP
jgi:multiple sugar transport system substrate-binding protein